MIILVLGFIIHKIRRSLDVQLALTCVAASWDLVRMHMARSVIADEALARLRHRKVHRSIARARGK